VTDVSERLRTQFTVTYSDHELRAYDRLMAERYARAQSEGTGFALLLAAILVLGLVILAAFKLQLIDAAAIRPVLLAAYFAFLAGITGYYLVMRAYFRKYFRTMPRGRPWFFCFDDTGIRYRTENIEVRLGWRAVESIQDFGTMVAVRFDGQAIRIPSRVFADDAARSDFIAAARALTKAASEKVEETA
jgi:hypothetical protein